MIAAQNHFGTDPFPRTPKYTWNVDYVRDVTRGVPFDGRGTIDVYGTWYIRIPVNIDLFYRAPLPFVR